MAQTEAARIRTLLLNEDAVGLQLTGADLLVYAQATTAELRALNFATKHITFSADKTKQRRLVPIPDNLVAWLAPHRGKTGRVCERWVRPQAFVQAFDRVGKHLGIAVGANRFRNSYITYRVALTHDVQRVSLESGNSPRVIQREYLELATEDDGRRWLNIFPPTATPAPLAETQPAPEPQTQLRKKRPV